MEETPRGRRRVYVPEMTRRTGYGPTWLRKLEHEGRIHRAHTDPGGKRKFWFDDEADEIVEGVPQRKAAEAKALT